MVLGTFSGPRILTSWRTMFCPGSVSSQFPPVSAARSTMTEPGQTVERHGVKILSPTNLPGEMPDHASQLYARNVSALLELMVKDGDLELNFEDEVIAGACITREGEIVHEAAKAAAGATPTASS